MNMVQNTSVVVSGMRLGNTLDSANIIHPSNHILFPNLSAIYRNFNQYKIKDFRINAQAIASSLQSGAYIIAATPSIGDVQSTNGPLFNFLANYATSEISSIWKSVSYKLARNISDRLKSYLINS
jgi:hypothetical protein